MASRKMLHLYDPLVAKNYRTHLYDVAYYIYSEQIGQVIKANLKTHIQPRSVINRQSKCCETIAGIRKNETSPIF